MMKRWHILSTLFLLIGLANLIRAGMGVYIAPALKSLSLSLPLPLLSAGYLLCGLCFVTTAIIYWRRKTSHNALKLATAYQAILWIIHLAGDRSEYARSLWPRDAVLTLAFLALVAFLSHKRKPSQTDNPHPTCRPL